MKVAEVILRQWKDSDLDSFARMNADPEVMVYMLKTLSHDESSFLLQKLKQSIEKKGWGLWAVEHRGELAGFTGLSLPAFTATFTPCVEIGWRLHRKFWGRGIAFAAARQAETYAFRELNLPELVSFTTGTNLRSRALMERLGFHHEKSEDFLHPNVPQDHPLRPHVFYRKKADTFFQA